MTHKSHSTQNTPHLKPANSSVAYPKFNFAIAKHERDAKHVSNVYNVQKRNKSHTPKYPIKQLGGNGQTESKVLSGLQRKHQPESTQPPERLDLRGKRESRTECKFQLPTVQAQLTAMSIEEKQGTPYENRNVRYPNKHDELVKIEEQSDRQPGLQPKNTPRINPEVKR